MDQASKSAASSGPPTHEGVGPGGPNQPGWTDDRAWIGAIRHAPDKPAKLAALSEWVTAYGGETCGRTALLPPLRHHRVRRLAESELRRMVRQLGLEVVEDERP